MTSITSGNPSDPAELSLDKLSSSISYDDPFEGISHSKLSFINDPQLDSLSRNGFDSLPADKVGKNQSEIVTSLTSIKGQRQDIVLKNVLKHSVSEHKGTIASKTTEVQTDLLSPNSEQELMSQPFPRSDILVEGHGDTCVSPSDGDQGQSPMYASVDSEKMIPGSGEIVLQPSLPGSEPSFQSKDSDSHHGIRCDKEGLSEVDAGSNVQNVAGFSNVHVLKDFPDDAGTSNVPEQSVGFCDPMEEDLNDDELNLYLNELDGGTVDDFSSSKEFKTNIPSDHECSATITSESESGTGSSQGPLQSDQNCDIMSNITTNQESNVFKAVSDLESEIKHPVIECVSDSPEQNILPKDDSNIPINSDIYNTNTEERSDSLITDEAFIYDSLTKGKTEIEQILDEKVKADVSPSSVVSIGETLCQGKMEIERILDEVTQNQQNVLKMQNKPKQSSHSVCTSSPNSGPMSGLEITTPDKSVNVPIGSNDTHSIISNSTPLSSLEMGSPVIGMGIGARPKDPASIKKNRPNSLLGLSKVGLESPIMAQHSDLQCFATPPKPMKALPSDPAVRDETERGECFPVLDDMERDECFPVSEQKSFIAAPSSLEVLTERQRTVDGGESSVVHHLPQHVDVSSKPVYNSAGSETSELATNPELPVAGNGAPKMKRPNSLNLPSRPEFNLALSDEEPVEQTEGKL